MRYQIKFSFSDKLKRARKAAKLTQKELAEKTGVSQNSINSYELGRRKPSNENLKKLSLFFKIDEEKFLEDELIYPTRSEMIKYNYILFDRIQAESNRILVNANKGKTVKKNEDELFIKFDFHEFINRNYLIHLLLSFFEKCDTKHLNNSEYIYDIGHVLDLILKMSEEDVKEMIDFGINLKNKKRFIESDD